MHVRFLTLLNFFCFRRSSVAVLVLLTTLSITSPVGLLRAAPPDEGADAGTVAVVFDSLADPHADSYIHALFLQNLLTHFNLHAALIPITEYKRGQLADYRAGFLLTSALNTQVPPALLADIRATDQPFAWLGGHIDQLLATPDARRHYGFSFVEYRRDLDYRFVSYKQTLLPKPETDLTIVSVQDPSTAEVIATAINQKKVSSPYVVKSGNVWFFAIFSTTFWESIILPTSAPWCASRTSASTMIPMTSRELPAGSLTGTFPSESPLSRYFAIPPIPWRFALATGSRRWRPSTP
jgi:hypothetical protein